MTPPWALDAAPNMVALAVMRCLCDRDLMTYDKWRELGLITDAEARIIGHPRLTRSLAWGDDDYPRCVQEVLADLLGETRPREVPPPPTAAGPAALAYRHPNLHDVADFVDLPAWLAVNDNALFNRIFDTGADATMPDGTVLTAAESAAAELQIGEMRRQVDRIRTNFADDPAGAVGASKDLIETVCKSMIGLIGDGKETKPDVLRLIERTLRHFGLSGADLKESGGDALQIRAAQTMLGGVTKILVGADELRNARGTGHGRAGVPEVDPPVARLAVSMTLAAVVYLCEVYQAQLETAPSPADVLTGARGLAPMATPRESRSRSALTPRRYDLQPGSVIRHESFGEGIVVAREGHGSNTVASVNFGVEAGIKRLLMRYAPVEVVRVASN